MMIDMNESIIITIILGTASIISSICFGLVPSIRRDKLNKLSNKIIAMKNDIKFFYNLEQCYIEELSKITGKNKETIKKGNRAKIKNDIGYSLSQYAKPSTFK